MIEEAPLHADLAEGPEGGQAWWLTAADGVRLRLTLWGGGAKGTVFLFQGRAEYAEKYGPAAADLAGRGYSTLVIDWRGQGLSDRLIDDPVKGYVGAFSDYQRDVDAMLAAAARLDLPRPWVVLAHSMGGTIALRRLMGAHPFAAVAFSAPMWGVGLPRVIKPFGGPLARMTGGSPLALTYAPGWGPVSFVHRAGFHDNFLTSDPDMWSMLLRQVAKAPGLAIAGACLHWVAEAVLECEALTALPAPDLPCYCALGTRERIVPKEPIRTRMGSWPQGQLALYDGAEHEVMMEGPAMRARFYDACAALFDAHRG
ncbi:lysophospholipase [Rhodobacter viridis]|uniref:Lysophospholipase n=1 Tax=Rhodobacter viridis TaxID=1054202 RepID=A0A318TWI1_9RHOB|nr:alpha/beta hydrolase [Rhodobacter viridis]PYF09206.1 lysophospholipase [Rhodobacter viridis]